MSLKKYLTSVPIIVTAIFSIGSYIGIVYALNTWDTGYQLTSGQVRDMNLADSTCKRVTNNATNRFIGTKTMAEWNSFNAVAASQGVTVAGCGPTYPSCNTPDITIPSIGQSWAACNIGATTPSGYGNYYQWGMNNTSFVEGRLTLPAGGWTASPCAVGYHIPTAAEITALTNSSEAIAIANSFGRPAYEGAGLLLNLPHSNMRWDLGGPYQPGAFSQTWCADRGIWSIGVWYPDSLCIIYHGGHLVRGTNTDHSGNGYAFPIRCKHD